MSVEAGGIRSLELDGVSDVYEPPVVGAEPGPLEKQQTLLTSGKSL